MSHSEPVRPLEKHLRGSYNVRPLKKPPLGSYNIDRAANCNHHADGVRKLPVRVSDARFRAPHLLSLAHPVCALKGHDRIARGNGPGYVIRKRFVP